MKTQVMKKLKDAKIAKLTPKVVKPVKKEATKAAPVKGKK